MMVKGLEQVKEVFDFSFGDGIIYSSYGFQSCKGLGANDNGAHGPVQVRCRLGRELTLNRPAFAIAILQTSMTKLIPNSW